LSVSSKQLKNGNVTLVLWHKKSLYQATAC
jgi:hypothetical protein